jgi:aurora kinase, other
MQGLEYVQWSQLEWEARFSGPNLRPYPNSEGMKRSLLGKGGFASVYRVRIAGQIFAAKVLKMPKLRLNEDQAEEIKKESNILQKLKHKHVIQYTNYFFDKMYAFLILEYASGGSLADHLTVEMSTAVQQRLMTELANGLLYIHEQHVIHRDLKSSNVLLVGNELAVMRVKISDFGLSSQLSSTVGSKRESKSGTPFYLSPERGMELPYDYPADMWAAGCIFIEVVLKESLKESLWPPQRKDLLQQKLNDATRRNPILGRQASNLLLHDANKRLCAFKLYTALRQVK